MTFLLRFLHGRVAFFSLVEGGAYTHMGDVNTGTKRR